MSSRAFAFSFSALLAIATVTGCSGGSSNSGQILFGTAIDTSNFTVTTPVTTIKTGADLGWVAYLNDSVNGTTMTLTVALVGNGGAETNVATVPVSVSDPNFNEFAHQPDTSLTSQDPGMYTLRYIRPSDSKVLAQGSIQITP